MSITIEKYPLIYYVKRSGTPQRVARIKLHDTQDRHFANLYFYKEGQQVPDSPWGGVTGSYGGADGGGSFYKLPLSEN